MGKSLCRWARMSESARQQIGRDERQRDLPQRPQRRRAEVLRGFLQRHAGLLEPGGDGSDDIREPPHGISDDEERGRVFCGVEEREDSALLCHGEVAERQHQPRHGQRKHGAAIQQSPARKRGAHDHVSDADPQKNVGNGGEARVFEAVEDGGNREVVPQRGLVMGQRPFGGEDGAIPFVGKGDEHDARVR